MTFFISCLLPAFSTFTPSSFAMSRFEKSSKLGNWGREVTEDSVTRHPVGVIPHHFMKYFTRMNDSQDLWEVKMVTRPLSESRASVLYAKSTLLERRIISRLPPM
ncbi:hypothetical protein Q3G72_000504 [Acer saccharum]|nr:hypothetical protein Q3G72_000504 [Acer saccharum]